MNAARVGFLPEILNMLLGNLHTCITLSLFSLLTALAVYLVTLACHPRSSSLLHLIVPFNVLHLFYALSLCQPHPSLSLTYVFLCLSHCLPLLFHHFIVIIITPSLFHSQVFLSSIQEIDWEEHLLMTYFVLSRTLNHYSVNYSLVKTRYPIWFKVLAVISLTQYPWTVVGD